jgi:hypothetical protein
MKDPHLEYLRLELTACKRRRDALLRNFATFEALDELIGRERNPSTATADAAALDRAKALRLNDKVARMWRRLIAAHLTKAARPAGPDVSAPIAAASDAAAISALLGDVACSLPQEPADAGGAA